MGTQAQTSGSILSADRHDPKFVNDGRYGNSSSWLGNEAGHGWIELVFDQPQDIDRVVWSRDRNGPFEDRLPIDYRIEVSPSVAGDSWQTVPTLRIDGSGLPAWTSACVRFGWVITRRNSPSDAAAESQARVEAEIKALETGQLAFAGKFRAPDEIHLLIAAIPNNRAKKCCQRLSAHSGESFNARCVRAEPSYGFGRMDCPRG